MTTISQIINTLATAMATRDASGRLVYGLIVAPDVVERLNERAEPPFRDATYGSILRSLGGVRYRTSAALAPGTIVKVFDRALFDGVGPVMPTRPGGSNG